MPLFLLETQQYSLYETEKAVFNSRLSRSVLDQFSGLSLASGFLIVAITSLCIIKITIVLFSVWVKKGQD